MKTSGLRYSFRSFLALFAISGVGGTLSGCPLVNDSHCAINEGACGDGMACSKCEVSNNGCVAPDAIVDPLCAFNEATTAVTTGPDTLTTGPTTTTPPDTTETSLPSDPTIVTTEDVSATDTSTTSTTVDPDTTATSTTSTTEPAACNEAQTGDEGCAPPAPYCVVDTCVSCDADEVDCETKFPDAPNCNSDKGVCVECVDNKDCKSESMPYCDQETAKCMPCTMHEQCFSGDPYNGPGTACNLETGACFPKESVIYVENTPATCSDSNDGTDPAMPICHLADALATVQPGTPTTIKLGQGGLQTESAAVPGNVTVAIVPNGPTNPFIARNGAEPALDVLPGALVFVHHVSMYNNMLMQTTAMARCTDATLWLEKLNIYQGKTGVLGTNCKLHLRRAVVFQNSNGGIDMTTTDGASTLWLENSFVTSNGPVYGVRLTNTSNAKIVYSTIAGNKGTVAPIACTNVPGNVVELRNSLIADGNDKYTSGCGEPEAAMDSTNVLRMEATTAALVSAGVCSGYADGVLRAKINGPLKDAATWLPGDPTNDFDEMDVRPSADPPKDYAGADVP